MGKQYERLFVLTDLKGRLLTLNPATDEFVYYHQAIQRIENLGHATL